MESYPYLLALPNGELISVLIHPTNKTVIQQYGSSQHIEVSGSFSESIAGLFNSSAPHTSRNQLRLLENQYSWLSGLSEAIPRVSDGRDLLLGKQLGMLFVELTSRCNERCVHCYADSAPERNDFLNLDEVKEVLKEARMLGKANVQFTGGDPLIHRDLLEILDFASGLDFASLEIYTNGLLLSDAFIQKIRKYNPKIAFSMYSHLPETHDLITGVAGSHKRTCAAIKRAQHAGFPVRVSVIRMLENQGQEESTFHFLQALGLEAEQINFHLNRDIGRGMAFVPKPETVSNTEQKHVNTNTQTIENGTTQKERLGKLCISATGDIYPCVFSRHTSLGNIRESSLSDSMNSLKTRPFSAPSAQRWKSCQDELSCGDCQMVTYMLGEDKQ